MTSAWLRLHDGRWLHRPWWKVALNSLLRWLQPKRSRKLVICTRAYMDDPSGTPRVIGYTLAFIAHDVV